MQRTITRPIGDVHLLLRSLCVWVALASCMPRSAYAQPLVRVVVLDPGKRELAERLRDELNATSFHARLITAPSRGDLALRLAEFTLREDAQLGVTLRTTLARSELLIYDAQSGSIVAHPLDPEPNQNDAQLAIRVVELVRATQLTPTSLAAREPARKESSPAAPSSPPEKTEPPAPAPTPKQDKPTDSALKFEEPLAVEPSRSAPRPFAALELGVPVLASPGGLGPSMALSVAASVFVSRSLRLGAFALVPLTAMTHSAQEGSSRTRVTPIGLEFGGEFLRDSPFRISLDGGFLVVIVATEGHSALLNFADLSTRRASVGAHVRGGLSYHFTRMLAVRGALIVAAQLSSFSIEYVGRRAASWGTPWFAAQLAFEVRFSGNT